ncbi:GOSR1 protein, partial [Atractosteus spatula]|nr:GOSR1 protein [Atractosteus spatula]
SLPPPTDLRKQARQLENELDLKLVSFSKLCTSYSSSREARRGDSSDTTPLLNNSTQDRMFETMAVEIEQLLTKLTGVNDKMAEYTSTPGAASLNAALMHTLQRHRDILQDYTHEFHKTKANFLAIREREDLLGSVRKDIETYKSASGVNNRRTELFLKEHEHLRKCGQLPAGPHIIDKEEAVGEPSLVKEDSPSEIWSSIKYSNSSSQARASVCLRVPYLQEWSWRVRPPSLLPQSSRVVGRRGSASLITKRLVGQILRGPSFKMSSSSSCRSDRLIDDTIRLLSSLVLPLPDAGDRFLFASRTQGVFPPAAREGGLLSVVITAPRQSHDAPPRITLGALVGIASVSKTDPRAVGCERGASRQEPGWGGIAMATKENMTSQRGLLKSIQSRVNTLANRFPAINNLIQRINLRKRRDSLILGGVIGVCTILLLLYAFH